MTPADLRQRVFAVRTAVEALVSAVDELDGLPPAPAAPADRLLTVEEAAARLNVKVPWLYRNVTRYPFVLRMGRLVRFSEAGLDRWLARAQK